MQELLELKEFVDELKSEIDEAIQDLIDIWEEKLKNKFKMIGDA